MKIQTKNIIGTEIDQNFQKDWENSKKNDRKSNYTHIEVILLKKLIYDNHIISISLSLSLSLSRSQSLSLLIKQPHLLSQQSFIYHQGPSNTQTTFKRSKKCEFSFQLTQLPLGNLSQSFQVYFCIFIWLKAEWN